MFEILSLIGNLTLIVMFVFSFLVLTDVLATYAQMTAGWLIRKIRDIRAPVLTIVG